MVLVQYSALPSQPESQIVLRSDERKADENQDALAFEMCDCRAHVSLRPNSDSAARRNCRKPNINSMSYQGLNPQLTVI